MSWSKGLAVLVVLGLGLGGLAMTGHLPHLDTVTARFKASPDKPDAASNASPATALTLTPAVTVARAEMAEFVETVLVTGSLVAREEILVGPEVEGLRVVEVLVDEGDRVLKGQVLARLVSDTLEAQLAQNTASLAKSEAAIAQAQSAIASAEARADEARNAYERAQPLTKSGYLSESSMDQRESARRTAEAALTSSRDGLKLAQAEKAVVEAQHSEIVWRRARTDMRAPAAGLISRRNVKVGGYASGLAEPMFRIVAKGEIELDAEVPETRLGSIRDGQQAEVEAAGAAPVAATVRLVSPEVDRTTRLGRVRLFIGDKPGLRVGSFARAKIETGRSRGLAVPSSAVLYTAQGPVLQVVIDNKVVTKPVVLGLAQNDMIEVREGLAAGDAVVARSGTFLRNGDAVRPIDDVRRRISEAG